MIRTMLVWLDGVLRRPASGCEPLPWVRLVICQGVCGFLYGIVMGSFGEWDGNRFWYALFAGIKVPLLFWVTFSLCVPVFFVLHTMLGLRDDLSEALRSLLAAQAVLTLVLLGLAPVTWWWYLSSDDYQLAVVFNGLMFAVASVGAQLYLQRLYSGLITRNARHRTLLSIWLGLYAFVAIQFAWVLRPFVGSPGVTAEFFRSESWGNAYVALFRVLSGSIR